MIVLHFQVWLNHLYLLYSPAHLSRSFRIRMNNRVAQGSGSRVQGSDANFKCQSKEDELRKAALQKLKEIMSTYKAEDSNETPKPPLELRTQMQNSDPVLSTQNPDQMGSQYPEMMEPPHPRTKTTPNPKLMEPPHPRMMMETPDAGEPGFLGALWYLDHVRGPNLLSMDLAEALDQFKAMNSEERERQIFYLQYSGPLVNEKAHLLKQFLMIENVEKTFGQFKSVEEQLETYWKTREHFGHPRRHIASLHSSVREAFISDLTNTLSNMEKEPSTQGQCRVLKIILTRYIKVHRKICFFSGPT
jgi:hypothetical protein